MKIIFTFILITFGLTIYAKPRTINIDKELSNAQTIELCRIIDYTDSCIIYETEFLQTPNIIVGIRKVNRTAKLHRFEKSYIGTMVSGGIPKINEDCLIVIDTSGYVSLFGKKSKENIVFWSPIYTESTCLIKHSELFSSFEKDNDIDNNKDLLLTWTSVKISIDLFYENFKHRILDCGSILFQGAEILFIPDFSGSRAYSIKNAKEFDIKDNSSICIEGYLLKSELTMVRQIKK